MTRGSRRPGRRAALVIAALPVSLVGTPRLRAAELDGVALVWTAPAGCPSADAVHQQVTETLGGPARELAPVAAIVTVAREAGRWRANLALQAGGQRSERQYVAESCDALGAATALIVALAAEGMEAPGAAATGDGEGPRPGRDGSPGPAAPPLWVGASNLIQVGATFDDGTMPYAFAPGIEASAGRLWEASFWRLRLLGSGSYYFTQTGGGGAGDWYLGTYWLLSFAARACATATLGRLELGPCLGGEFVFMHGNDVGGTGVGNSQDWLAPLGGLMASVAASSRLGFFARSEVTFPTTLRTFMGKPPTPGNFLPIYDVPAHAFRAVAGIEWRIF